MQADRSGTFDAPRTLRASKQRGPLVDHCNGDAGTGESQRARSPLQRPFVSVWQNGKSTNNSETKRERATARVEHWIT